MYKLCVAFAALLAVAAAKPSLGYAYDSYVAPVASYSAYPAPAVYSANSVYSPSLYSAPVYSAYAAAPVAAVAPGPVAAYAAPVAAYASAGYPAYSSYSAPLAYDGGYPSSFLWKKK